MTVFACTLMLNPSNAKLRMILLLIRLNLLGLGEITPEILIKNKDSVFAINQSAKLMTLRDY